MEKLNLNQTWELGEPLDADPGGFGRLFLARSAAGEEAVAKLVRKEPGAEREMLFDGAGKPNVVPILDSGEHDDDWVIIMPRAQKSLRRHLTEHGGKLPLAECIQVLTDVATALDGLDGDIVHRDLKPENVLQLNGIWCLADFGLARYAEAATATHTSKFRGTEPYVAPERWRMERAAIASDVYALGVIGYEIFSGNWPFPGPDFRHQALHESPPRLPEAGPLYASLIGACLYRAPQARPTPATIVTRLAAMAGPPLTGGLAALAQANAEIVTRTAAAQQRESQQRTEEDRRRDLFEVAIESLEAISEAILTTLNAVAPAGRVSKHRDGWTFALGGAELTVHPLERALPEAWSGDGAPVPFDVIAHTAILLSAGPNRFGYQGRSHSLWFCDAQAGEQYAWFETAFWEGAWSRQIPSIDPYALPPEEEARRAFSGGVPPLAWPFTSLEPGGLEDFVGRWANWLAQAANGLLTRPNPMPEKTAQGSHR